MSDNGRTFVIGDIHGDSQALDTLMQRILPRMTRQDTLVFIGDYVDRGPDSRGVVRRVRSLLQGAPCKVVALRGNHEDKWVECYAKADPVYMLPAGNGCAQTFRSFLGMPPLGENDSLSTAEYEKFFKVKEWMPQDVAEWMDTLPYWHEDLHALYVHAGLDGDGDHWKHPSQCNEKTLLWMRKPSFFERYRGKRVVFGHTLVGELPENAASDVSRMFEERGAAWFRGDLVGIDTGSGKGGFLSALELPAAKVWDSR